MTTNPKKIFAVIAGIVFIILTKLIWQWKKTGGIGKMSAMVLSLVFFILGLASFYVAAPESITRAADVDVSISLGTDDGFCYAGSTCYLTGGNIRLGYRPSLLKDCYAGFRFQNIVIPNGATIDDAYFTYNAFDTDASNDNVKIWAEAADDGVTFTTSGVNSPEGKTAGAVSVAWTLPHQVDGNSYTSPDIKTVVQEVINRGGWSSGNALVILVRNNGATENHNACDFNATPLEGASIAINFTVGGGAERRIIKIE